MNFHYIFIELNLIINSVHINKLSLSNSTLRFTNNEMLPCAILDRCRRWSTISGTRFATARNLHNKAAHTRARDISCPCSILFTGGRLLEVSRRGIFTSCRLHSTAEIYTHSENYFQRELALCDKDSVRFEEVFPWEAVALARFISLFRCYYK